MLVLSFYLNVCSRMLSLAFCFTKILCETLCKFLYFYASLKYMFMQSIMVNRKLFGNFEFLAPLQKRYIFLLFISLLFLLFWIIYRKRKQKRKSRFLVCFCRKTPVFVANNVLIFRYLHLYRANHTPPPAFGTRRVGQLSSENFLFFLFFYFL